MKPASTRSAWKAAIDRNFAREQIQTRVPVQGNVDPLILLAGGAALDREVDAVLDAFAGGPFIFNLGHGILPETPIAHVERLVDRVRGWRTAARNAASNARQIILRPVIGIAVVVVLFGVLVLVAAVEALYRG